MHFHEISFGSQHEIWSKQHNGKVRTIAFSKKRERLEQQLHVAFAYSHFIKPHLGLRQRVKGMGKKYRDQTPMMAAGITDHIWTMSELFSQALFELS